jgi:hypothetical protein
MHPLDLVYQVLGTELYDHTKVLNTLLTTLNTLLTALTILTIHTTLTTLTALTALTTLTTHYTHCPHYTRYCFYDHSKSDTVENIAEAANMVADPAYADAVKALSKQLRAGWRAAKEEGEVTMHAL